MNFKKGILLLLFCILYLVISSAQDLYMDDSQIQSQLKIQAQKGQGKGFFSLERLSIGAGGGINFSIIIPFSRNSIFSGLANANYDKEYNAFIENLGTQFGFYVLYDINQFIKLSLCPSSNDYTYKYSTSYQWSGNTNLVYDTEYSQKIRMYEVPLQVGLYLNYGQFQPYFQGGVYYGRLVSGTSDMSVIESSSNLAGSVQSLNYSTSANSGNLYQKNHYGLLAGAGISYLFGKSRLSLEASYKVLLSDLNSVETVFGNNQIVSGNYDVPDKFKFSNLSVNLILVVPLKCKNSDSRGSAVFCE